MSKIKTVLSTAPTRICDLGGWTDTWFAEYGEVLNIAITPEARVRIIVFARGSQENCVTLHAKNYDDDYAIDLHSTDWKKHPLLEASIRYIGIPETYDVRIIIFSDAPPGASMGTSAAVTVALIAALRLLNDQTIDPHEIAYQAHHVESVLLGRQCGIQDQLAAAYGGICYIKMHDYPHATVDQIILPEALSRELSKRLMTIYSGSSHDSSQIHETVIANLENAGSEAPALQSLRTTAQQGKAALLSGDLDAFSAVMTRNTEMQRALHPDLVNADIDQLIEIARSCNASGWKVNGAGGNGGTLTILCDGDEENRRRLRELISRVFPAFEILSTRISRQGVKARITYYSD